MICVCFLLIHDKFFFNAELRVGIHMLIINIYKKVNTVVNR